MNKAVVVFLKDEPHVYQLIESGAAPGPAFWAVGPGAGSAASAAGVDADSGVECMAAGATGSHSEDNDLDREEQSQPEKQQASVAAKNLSSSQSAGTEAASTSFAGRDHTVITNEGQGVFNSQVSCEGEDMEYDSESDTVSIGETSIRNTDLYSLEETFSGCNILKVC